MIDKYEAKIQMLECERHGITEYFADEDNGTFCIECSLEKIDEAVKKEMEYMQTVREDYIAVC